MAMTTPVAQNVQSGDVLNRLAMGLHSDAGVAPLGIGATTKRPTLKAADAGFMYYDTTLSLPVWWTGAAWHNAAGSVA